MNTILEYIRKTYHPMCIMVYGSYANGTNNEFSDFDCMIIVDKKTISHDSSVIDSVRLDLFIYTLDEISQITDIEEVIQIFDANIIYDTDNLGKQLKEQVQSYINEHSKSSEAEKDNNRKWLLKMVERTTRNDTEGYYRYHWALVDSLEIYCSMRDKYYFGPKKTIAYLKKNDKQGYQYLDDTLRSMDTDKLNQWIYYVIDVG